MTGISYLYGHSSVYRQMTDQRDFRIGSGDGSFSRFSNMPVEYERFVFHAGEASQLDMRISSELDRGQLAFWLVSPEGTVLLQTDPAESLDERITVDIHSGLWSLITVRHYDSQNQMSGRLLIEGAVTVGNS